jgi:hypothetical protein
MGAIKPKSIEDLADPALALPAFGTVAVECSCFVHYGKTEI